MSIYLGDASGKTLEVIAARIVEDWWEGLTDEVKSGDRRKLAQAFADAIHTGAGKDRETVNPEWKDGEPSNLAGAALDALEWLHLLRKILQRDRPPYNTLAYIVWEDAQSRLNRAIVALEIYMPESYKPPSDE